MHIYHYLCLKWHGTINPITMAATMREFNIHLSEGTSPTDLV